MHPLCVTMRKARAAREPASCALLPSSASQSDTEPMLGKWLGSLPEGQMHPQPLTAERLDGGNAPSWNFASNRLKAKFEKTSVPIGRPVLGDMGTFPAATSGTVNQSYDRRRFARRTSRGALDPLLNGGPLIGVTICSHHWIFDDLERDGAGNLVDVTVVLPDRQVLSVQRTPVPL
jgi:hypothetical protein